MVVGDGGEGGKEDGGNSASVGYYAQGSRSVGFLIWYQEWGGDRAHSKSTIGIPSSGIKKDCGDYGATYNKQVVGVAPGG